jgi:hypothetical protein
MGRKPWTTRPTTSRTMALRISDLKKGKVFDLPPGRIFTLTFSNPAFDKTLMGNGWRSLQLDCTYRIELFHLELVNPQNLRQKIAILRTPCFFGGFRRWFQCPDCGRRVGVVFIGQLDTSVGCRLCLDLAYESARTHDKRISNLIKKGIEAVSNAMTFGTHAQRRVAFTAFWRIENDKSGKLWKHLFRE